MSLVTRATFAILCVLVLILGLFCYTLRSQNQRERETTAELTGALSRSNEQLRAAQDRLESASYTRGRLEEIQRTSEAQEDELRKTIAEEEKKRKSLAQQLTEDVSDLSDIEAAYEELLADVEQAKASATRSGKRLETLIAALRYSSYSYDHESQYEQECKSRITTFVGYGFSAEDSETLARFVVSLERPPYKPPPPSPLIRGAGWHH